MFYGTCFELKLSNILALILRTCVSGCQYSLKSGGRDQWSYKYRATDLLVSICGPLHMIQEVVEICRRLDYEVQPSIYTTSIFRYTYNSFLTPQLYMTGGLMFWVNMTVQ